MRAMRIPFLAAMLGGAVVAVLFLALGVGSSVKTPTGVEQSPVAARPAASTPGLTAGAIYEKTSAGVVHVQSEIVQEVPSPFGLPSRQSGEATGSGVVIGKDGRILTNYHVIAGASRVSVKFENDRTLRAKVTGTDPSKDLALLKVDPGRTNLVPLTLGDSRGVKVGDPVLALGNPFGLDRTLTSGIVSAKQRSITAPNGFAISDVIQTDAAINPGNSGGPLLDAAGRVIGINSQIATGGSGTEANVGIGFAVPINVAKRDLPALEKEGRVKRPWLGVTIADVTPDQGLAAAQGALIARVIPGSPAAKAGVRAGPGGRGGDIVTAIDGTPVRSRDDLTSLVAGHQPGETITLKVVRAGSEQSVEVRLGTQPARAPSQ